ncbi:MAG: L-lactate dehydrogenase [Alphaproteobacteria bacterium]|nr:L-lactate dehydrogenase [Alphaproteobacteria bacterium]USO08002.1 MAG: L-lactate dehydrogenase [Rhodospirillales bacterium]
MKIGVVGTGFVGSACANACVLRGVGTGLTLVDHNPDLAAAQAEDILHATPFARSMPVRAGGYDDLAGCGIVMIAAGVNQKPGETRLDLLKRNADIFADMVPRIIGAAPGATLLVATNPVDIMTHITTKMAEVAGLSPNRVIGSGTMLDTARFRALLGQAFGVSSHSVHAYVLGEHGDSEVLHWSGASVGTMSLGDFATETGTALNAALRKRIDDGVRHAAARIIKGKGATYYGIGAGMARIAKAIIEDENAVMTCTQRHTCVAGVENVSLSLPVIINAGGVARVLTPRLDKDEETDLARSATILREAATQIGV